MTTSSNNPLNQTATQEHLETFEQIINLLDRFKLFHSTVFVSGEHSSEAIPAIIALINPFSHDFILRPLLNDKPFPAFKENHLKIQNESNNISFVSSKGTICRPHFLTIKMPKTITLINYRNTGRLDIENENIKTSHTNYTAHNFQMETHQLQSQLVDLSTSGVGLKSINPIWKQLRANDKITLNSLGPKPLNEKITGTVVYIKNIPNDIIASGSFQIGIRFTHPIDVEALLEKIKK